MGTVWTGRIAASWWPEAGLRFFVSSSVLPLLKVSVETERRPSECWFSFPINYPFPPKADPSKHRAAVKSLDHQEPLVFSLVTAFRPRCFLFWQLISRANGRWQEPHTSIKAYVSPEHAEEKEETSMEAARIKEFEQEDQPPFWSQRPPTVSSLLPPCHAYTSILKALFPDLHVLLFINY